MSPAGQSETNVTTEPWSAVEWIADADLTRASFYWDSVPQCRNPPSACQVRGRAIPCSDCAKQRHDIIPNRLALTAEESVSGVTGATAQVNQETPPMRIYIIGNDGITLCREPPATVNKGEVAVASREELHAARLSGKRLLALWNALPGVEKQTLVRRRRRPVDRRRASCAQCGLSSSTASRRTSVRHPLFLGPQTICTNRLLTASEAMACRFEPGAAMRMALCTSGGI